MLVVLAACSPAAADARGIDRMVERDVSVASRALAATSQSLPPGRYPGRSDAVGRWGSTGPASWTSGFYPASLWLMAELTGDPRWRAKALSMQRDLRAQRLNDRTHDVGFIVLLPFGRCHKLTRSADCRRVVLRAARSLASRYDPVVGATRSWGAANARPFKVIIDNLMNVELLLWAQRRGGPDLWREIAVRHGLRALRDHVRADGSTFHVVDYDADTGQPLARRTRQGFSDGSTWSRGQAWAIHGFGTLYRHTRDPRFLGGARRVADHWLARMPRGGVPPWDFDAPLAAFAPRDSSAAAVAASGLLGLARVEASRGRAARYRLAAVRTLRSLSSDRYLARRGGAILKHGTSDGARGQFGGGLVYGDYYFLEALARLRAGY